MPPSDGRVFFLRVMVRLLAGAVALLTGCATSVPPSAWSDEQTAALCAGLIRLSERVDTNDAALVAQAAVQYSVRLAQQYRAVQPPWIHNHFVNAGYRDRGLCYHWANDLFARLSELPLQSLELHLAVAHIDTRREHNAVVITADGQPFSEGVVLDAWRHSGRLWWGRADADKYPWQPLPYERVNPALQRFVVK